MHDIDHNSYEIGAIRLTLRRELAFRRQSFGGDACYVIEDTAKSQFFRIGIAEYTFASLLDGKTSIAVAVAETASRTGSAAFTETQAAAFCSWLVDNGLASTAQSSTSDRLNQSAEKAASRRRREWLNPLMLKFPLGNPDSAIRSVHSLAGWIFGQAAFFAWLIVVITGGYFLLADWERLTASSSGVLSTQNWIWLGLSWLSLKLVHEFAHGLVCRRFDGETREAGILLLLFVPLPYVDVTSSWRFGSKWQRMSVAAAGMYAELFLAAIAAIVWATTSSPLLQHHAFNVLVTAGFVTVLFNINPLMKFDGYYILSDLFETPNLATHGQQDLLGLARRWLLGGKCPRQEWPEGRATLIRCYGIAAFCWRIMICVSLTLAAETLFHGAGVVLAAAAVVLWVAVPLFKFTRYVVIGDPVNPPDRTRLAAVSAIVALLGYGIWNYVPYVERLQLPAIVDYDPVDSVRVATSGFVRQILVESGDTVVAGQPLLHLENIELQTRLTETELAVAKSQLDATQFHRHGKLAAYQVELENEVALRKQLNELQRQTSGLIVSAPQAGRVLTRQLQDFQDRWVTAGTEVCLLGADTNRSVQIVIPQSDLKRTEAIRNKDVTVHIWGMGNHDLTGNISSIDPRGTTDLKHPALAAAAGGPLSIRPAIASETSNADDRKQQWQLLEPHFGGRVDLPNHQLDTFASGRTGYVEFSTIRGTVGDVVVTALKDFYGNRQTNRQ